MNGKIGVGKDRMCSYKHTHNSAVHIDYDGNTVGYNRPDIQFNLNGKKYNIEIDTEIKSSFNHQRTIPLKDSSSQNLFFIIRAGAFIKAPKVRPSAPKF